MKTVISCESCQLAAVKQHVGFFGEDEIWCTLSHVVVDRGDGCTFGERGEPGVAVRLLDVDLGGDAAVRGW
ncbi:MAG: hypothetical protein SOW20_08145 [Berryella intestinalis]|uniref:hypothetical protein n=1 Tax=Berryella intestinalis TaxID=1531429 RepID=UPI002A7569E7|nr:hypothetical protein [Berryella intestinalis]MDY3129974.1 hypothetical protein [Berryella intestinalis]